MRPLLAALALSLGLSCSGAGMTQAQTAQVVVTATASVLQLVAAILSQVSEQAGAAAAKCLSDPDACVLPDPAAAADPDDTGSR